MGTGEYVSVKADMKYRENRDINPIKNGFVMFLSFVSFGCIPLILYYLITLMNVKNIYVSTYISIIIALFILGVIKSKYTKEIWYISGASTSLYGGVASFVAYNVSKFVSNLN